MLKARSNPSVSLPLGDQWVIDVRATDTYGAADDSALTITVTDPGSSTASPDLDTSAGGGRSVVTIELALAGRYVAHVAGAAGAVDFTAFAAPVTTGANLPSVTDLDDYLGNHSHTDAALTRVLATETAAQRKVCRIPPDYDADLAEAVLRRCAVNLAKRRVPLGVLQGDADAGAARVPARDPEVRRLEGPYRKLHVG